MKEHIKQVAKSSKNIVVLFKMYENWATKRRFESGDVKSLLGSTHASRSLPESIDYINAQFNDYLTYSGLSQAELQDKRIFELGFGDNVGVALKFLSAGAARVVCLDKFYAKRDPDHERLIYLQLREALDAKGKRLFDQAIDISSGITINPERLKCIYGVDVEDSNELANENPFDMVISRGAVQDIYQPDAALSAMDKILAAGGVMMHKIDLSDQGMFRDHGMNPLTFLTISEPVYQFMAKNSGRSNRKLINYYRRKLSELGYDAKLLITDVIGSRGKGDLQPHEENLKLNSEYAKLALGLVEEIRPRLSKRFKALSDEELMISGIFIVAKKPTP